MNVFDLHHDILPALSLESSAVTTLQTSAIVDTATYEGLEFLALAATITADVVVLVEEGDDSALSDAATVDADLVLGQTANPFAIATTDSDTALSFGYIGKKRYVRVSLGGGSSNGVVGLSSILWGAHHKPAQD